MADFDAELNLIRSNRQKTLSMIENLSDSELQTRPSARKWSIAEILDHLILGMRFYRGELERLIEMKKSGKDAVLERTFADFNPSILHIPRSVLSSMQSIVSVMSKSLPDTARAFVMRSRLIPTQNPDVAQPRKGREPAGIRQDLLTTLQDLELLLVSNADLNYREMVHRHPLMGVSNALLILKLVALHERRHQSQIEKILNRRRA
jgi:hypothetical protein